MDIILEDKVKKFPPFLKVIFFVEMWERFSYYGMRALLVLFLTSQLGFEDKRAYVIYSLFAALSYIGPVIGGLLADKLMGFRSMVLLGGIAISLGHACMFFIPLNTNLTFLGLALIAIGTGLFKGNITSLLGSCYPEEGPAKNMGFNVFYVSVNLGSFLASLTCGYIASIYGWHYGFGLASIGMVAGLITFIKFQDVLGNSGLPTRPELFKKNIFLGLKPSHLVLMFSIATAFFIAEIFTISHAGADNIMKYCSILVVGAFAYLLYKSDPIEKRNLIVLTVLIIFLMLFFALEMQLGSLINLFAARNVVDNIFGLPVPAAVSQAINPLGIIIFGYLLSVYTNFSNKYAMFKFSLGLLFMALCFFVLYLGCLHPDSQARVGYLYLVFGITFMSVGELCIGPFVQAQATALAPKNFQGFVMGLLMLSLAFSNLMGIAIADFMAVPSVGSEIDYWQSLAIYREGFLKIGIFNFVIFCLFLILAPFLHKVIMNPEGRNLSS